MTTKAIYLSNAIARRYFLHAADEDQHGCKCCFFSNGKWGFWVHGNSSVQVDTVTSNGELPSRKIVDACVRAAVKFLRS